MSAETLPVVAVDGRCSFCQTPIIGVRPYAEEDGESYGIMTVRQDGSGCCSEYEGEFESVDMAVKQAEIAARFIQEHYPYTCLYSIRLGELDKSGVALTSDLWKLSLVMRVEYNPAGDPFYADDSNHTRRQCSELGSLGMYGAPARKVRVRIHQEVGTRHGNGPHGAGYELGDFIATYYSDGNRHRASRVEYSDGRPVSDNLAEYVSRVIIHVASRDREFFDRIEKAMFNEQTAAAV